MFDMTATVLRNFLSKTHTRLYPFQVRETFENVRGNLDIRIEECIMCGMCQKKCPSQCITVDNKLGTWDCAAMSCVYCGVCVDVCPTGCLSMSKEHRPVATEKQTMAYQGVPKKKKKEAAE